MIDRTKAFCSWSGGKESAMAFYEAERSGVTIGRLLNMVTEDGEHSRTHGLSSMILREQSDAIRIPLSQQKATWDTYEKEFKKAVSAIKDEGIYTGVFGDIDMIEHREWVERVCSETGVNPMLPLWLREREDLITGFIDAGFKAVVVATDARYMGEEWLGRTIDSKFVKDLKAFGKVDLCGEKGEYHSFVYDGPIFKRPVEFRVDGKVLNGDYWFLRISSNHPAR